MARLAKREGLRVVKILARRQTWLHTHFLTDGERLPAHRMREIESQIIPILRQLGIVYDIHFDAYRDDPGVRIILECIPLPHTLELIQVELTRIIQPIPAKPRDMHLVTFDRSLAAGDNRSPDQDLTTAIPEAETEG